MQIWTLEDVNPVSFDQFLAFVLVIIGWPAVSGGAPLRSVRKVNTATIAAIDVGVPAVIEAQKVPSLAMVRSRKIAAARPH